MNLIICEDCNTELREVGQTHKWVPTLKLERDALHKALADAAAALEEVVASETTDGNKNSYSAQVARGAAKAARAALLPTDRREGGT